MAYSISIYKYAHTYLNCPHTLDISQVILCLSNYNHNHINTSKEFFLKQRLK